MIRFSSVTAAEAEFGSMVCHKSDTTSSTKHAIDATAHKRRVHRVDSGLLGNTTCIASDSVATSELRSRSCSIMQ
jgi:hypothetical protein